MIAFLFKNWKYIIIAILIAVIGYYKLSNIDLEKNITKLTTDLAVSNSKLEATEAGVNLCNTRVDDLISNGELLSENISKAQVSAAKIRDNANVAIQELIKQKVPTDCQGALDWTYNRAKNTLKDWK